MKTIKEKPQPPRRPGEDIVQKKLDEANAFLQRMDPSILEQLRRLSDEKKS